MKQKLPSQPYLKSWLSELWEIVNHCYLKPLSLGGLLYNNKWLIYSGTENTCEVKGGLMRKTYSAITFSWPSLPQHCDFLKSGIHNSYFHRQVNSVFPRTNLQCTHGAQLVQRLATDSACFIHSWPTWDDNHQYSLTCQTNALCVNKHEHQVNPEQF